MTENDLIYVMMLEFDGTGSEVIGAYSDLQSVAGDLKEVWFDSDTDINKELISFYAYKLTLDVFEANTVSNLKARDFGKKIASIDLTGSDANQEYDDISYESLKEAVDAVIISPSRKVRAKQATPIILPKLGDKVILESKDHLLAYHTRIVQLSDGHYAFLNMEDWQTIDSLEDINIPCLVAETLVNYNVSIEED